MEIIPSIIARFTVLLGLAAVCAAGASCTTPKISKKRAAFHSKAYRPANPSNVTVKVSLANKMAYVLEGKKPLLVTPVAIGTPKNPTPQGSFRIGPKIAKKRSNTYGFWVNDNTGHVQAGKSSQRPGRGYRYVGYPMPYWCEFKPAYGFHAGAVWPIPRSHGCLRLHANVAPKFFNLVRRGTPVTISHTQAEDATLGKNVPRPKDYTDPDPPMPLIVKDNVAFKAPPQPLFEN